MNTQAHWFVNFALVAFTVWAPATTWPSTLEVVQDWRQILPENTKPGALAKVEVRNSHLSLAHTIELHVESLHATLAPVQANTPVELESLSTFKVTVDHATLQISEAVLQTLVQTELQATGSPLRIDRVNIQPSGIEIAGAINRLGLWIPFSMEGTPTVANASEIALTPSRLKVAGVPVYKALLATNIQLQSLIDMKSKAVALKGQAMVLRPEKVLQNPQIAFELNSLQLGQGEVNVSLGKQGKAPQYFCNNECPKNFAYTQGGALRAAGMVLAGQPTLLTGIANGALPISLHNLASLITTSTIQLRPDGALWISAQEGPLASSDLALLNSGEKTISQLEKLIANGVKQGDKQQAVTLAVHHATLLSKEGIEIRIEKLLASTGSTNLGQLPTAAQTVHAGNISLSENALSALMNKALFGFMGSPIRRVNSTLVENTLGKAALQLELQVKPEIFGIPLLWLPARLSGNLLISSDQLQLEFTPEQVHMFGLSVLPLLNYAGIELSSLIRIDQAAVQLQSNTLRIALNSALPPLQLNTRLRSIKSVFRAPGAPYLQVHVGTQPAEKTLEIEKGLEQLPVGLWMNTPEFTALGMRTGPTLGHVYPAPRNERLVIDLAQYPELLARATLRLPKTERVWVSMPSGQFENSEYPIQSHGHKNKTH